MYRGMKLHEYTNLEDFCQAVVAVCVNSEHYVSISIEVLCSRFLTAERAEALKSETAVWYKRYVTLMLSSVEPVPKKLWCLILSVQCLPLKKSPFQDNLRTQWVLPGIYSLGHKGEYPFTWVFAISTVCWGPEAYPNIHYLLFQQSSKLTYTVHRAHFRIFDLLEDDLISSLAKLEKESSE